MWKEEEKSREEGESIRERNYRYSNCCHYTQVRALCCHYTQVRERSAVTILKWNSAMMSLYLSERAPCCHYTQVRERSAVTILTGESALLSLYSGLITCRTRQWRSQNGLIFYLTEKWSDYIDSLKQTWRETSCLRQAACLGNRQTDWTWGWKALQTNTAISNKRAKRVKREIAKPTAPQRLTTDVQLFYTNTPPVILKSGSSKRFCEEVRNVLLTIDLDNFYITQVRESPLFTILKRKRALLLLYLSERMLCCYYTQAWERSLVTILK